jgi:hypothetical protein
MAWLRLAMGLKDEFVKCADAHVKQVQGAESKEDCILFRIIISGTFEFWI